MNSTSQPSQSNVKKYDYDVTLELCGYQCVRDTKVIRTYSESLEDALSDALNVLGSGLAGHVLDARIIKRGI